MVKASMGISPEDELILKQEVNIVFHLASSRVKGNEPIRYYTITKLHGA
jgi:hypothetical protein